MSAIELVALRTSRIGNRRKVCRDSDPSRAEQLGPVSQERREKILWAAWVAGCQFPGLAFPYSLNDSRHQAWLSRQARCCHRSMPLDTKTARHSSSLKVRKRPISVLIQVLILALLPSSIKRIPKSIDRISRFHFLRPLKLYVHQRRVLSFQMRCLFQHARRPLLRENRSKNGSGQHQDKNGIENPAINEALAGGVKGVKRNQSGRQCRR